MNSSDDDDDQVNDYQQQNNDDDLLSDDNEEEILASEDDDDSDEEDDDDDDEYDDRFSRFQIERKKDEMASDLEDDDDDDDNDNDGLPDVKAWGRDKKSYYHTDYIDKDYRSQKQRDQDLAQYEEEEALQIQKRLLESISDQDLGIDLLLENIRPKSEKLSPTIVEQQQQQTVESTIKTLPIGLTKEQKLTILKQESPELDLLKNDFENYWNEIRNKLQPLVFEFAQSKDSNPQALNILKLRLILLTNYLAHISLYSSMKCNSADRHSVKDHPIIKRLFTYKKLIKQLDDWIEMNVEFTRQIEFALDSIRNKRPIRFIQEEDIIAEQQQDSIVDQNMDFESIMNFMDDSESDDDDLMKNDTTGEEEEKRAITYEMEKNKGLTPKRKREQRNPRVKYRKKYEKAVIRRKGQVRLPRKELQKYGGEMTGINVRSVKSVKFK